MKLDMQWASVRPVLVMLLLGALLFAVPAAQLHDSQSRTVSTATFDITDVSANDRESPDPVKTVSVERSNVAQTNTRRLFTDFSDEDFATPEYYLAHEWTLPPVAELAIGYQQTAPPNLDWCLTNVSPTSRISGWKESNLSFRLNHPIPSFA
ncbi:hypothetical protein EZV61_13825 [Corallincola luteus]|uniref:Uncharacterized protein n=1 Tax=Corallincola luteus TaxID=1775177 RepID=A0ABY2ALQ1_9GAMM|nr:hypothetical protein EZV61_13825 [Corallincola luteus]